MNFYSSLIIIIGKQRNLVKRKGHFHSMWMAFCCDEEGYTHSARWSNSRRLLILSASSLFYWFQESEMKEHRFDWVGVDGEKGNAFHPLVIA